MRLQWSNWFELNKNTEWPTTHGVYCVSLADKNGRPFSIPRLCGEDPEGVIYIGRSGYANAKTDRSLGVRLWEFLVGKHSGGQTYLQSARAIKKSGIYKNYKLLVSIARLLDYQIGEGEKSAMRQYFNKYGEVPPCNSAFPGKWN